MSKRSYSPEFKLEVLKSYEENCYSISELISMYKVTWDSLMTWKRNFEKYGAEGLQEATTTKKYSKELKLAAIQDYQSGRYTIREVTRKYEISSTSVLRKWIKDYNCHREIKATSKGMSHSMTKGRSTTWEERIEIVTYCISNDKNFQKAAEIYKVSYQQVYQWVKKYEENGEQGLEDRRGRTKSAEELTQEDRMRLKIQQMECENERLRAENLFLKKLEEIERRHR